MKTRTTLRLGAVIIAVAATAFALTASAGSSISPKADHIAFMSTYDGEADIYTMSPASLTALNLTHDKTQGLRVDAEPAWSPHGEFVAFERSFVKGAVPSSQIYMVTSDGMKLGPVTAAQKGVIDTHPSWSPDGNSIVFSSNRDGNFDLYVVKTSGDALIQLTKTKLGTENLEPAWSPDGQSIVFTRQRATVTPSPSNVLVLSLATGRITKVTQPALMGLGDREPAWSPDSKWIAFSSDRLASSVVRSRDLYVAKVDGTGMTRITTQTSNEYHPTWSPFGDQLAFISDRTKATELYSLQLSRPTDTSVVPPPQKWQQLTFDDAYKSNPTWHGSIGMGAR